MVFVFWGGDCGCRVGGGGLLCGLLGLLLLVGFLLLVRAFHLLVGLGRLEGVLVVGDVECLEGVCHMVMNNEIIIN